MSIRKVKDAKDLATNELIYFKGHAKATYMSDGDTVENAIKNLEAGGNVDLSGYATNDYVNSKLEDKVNTSSLATVATSGSYNDLSNKPTIPTEVTESTVSGWGFVKSAGTYSKPSTGIPKTDLESAIQTSLDKADTALQEHQDISHLATKDEVADLTNEMIANEEVHAAAYNDLDSRLKDIGSLISGVAVTKEEFQEGIQNITNEIIANEEVHAAALNDLNERINAINENVSSGGDGSSSESGAYSEVNHGTSDTTFTLTPNTFHVWEEVSALTLTLGSETASVANEFLFQFTSGATPTSLTLPDNIKWANDSAPTIAENKIYQISILNKIACVMEVSYVNTIIFYVNGAEFYAESGMTWAEWCLSKYNTKQFMNYGSHIFATYPISGYIYVSPSSQINPNANYSIEQGSGGA